MFLVQKHVHWVGNVIPMPAHRLPKQILYGQLLHGCRSAGSQKKCFKDNLKTLLKKCNTKPPMPECLTADHDIWSSICHQCPPHLQEVATEGEHSGVHTDTNVLQGPRPQAPITLPLMLQNLQILHWPAQAQHITITPNNSFGTMSSSTSMDRQEQASKQACKDFVLSRTPIKQQVLSLTLFIFLKLLITQ